MNRRSMRFRITLVAVVICAVVLSASATVVVLVMRDQLWDSIDRTLAQRADQAAAAFSAEPGAVLANSDREDRFAQVLDASGSVIAASDNLAGIGPLVSPPLVDRATMTRTDIPIDDDAYRVMVRRFEVDEVDRYVVVGESVDDVQEAVRSLIATLALTIPIAVLVMGVAVWWLVGRTLAPVARMRREVDEIGLGALDRRVPAPGTGDEIDELATTMNSMLARLEESAGRQRRFVSDASHELRTPLARMRTTLEVELTLPRQPPSDGDLVEACRSALADVVDMQDLVDDLLFIARSDAARRAVAVVDLDVIVETEVRALRPASAVRIDATEVSAAAVLGDAGELARLVRNLLSNAVRHARTAVVVTLAERDVVELVVDDDGPGIAEAERDRVFERFVRLDEARTRTDGGSGLGLAIARDIVIAHGGEITVGEAAIGGARLRVTLPVVAADHPPQPDAGATGF